MRKDCITDIGIIGSKVHIDKKIVKEIECRNTAETIHTFYEKIDAKHDGCYIP